MSAHIMPKIHLKQAINTLSLRIGLMVETCRELKISSQQFKEFHPKSSNESWVSIAYNAFWSSPQLHDMLDEEARSFICFIISWCDDESCILAESVNNYHDASTPSELGRS